MWDTLLLLAKYIPGNYYLVYTRYIMHFFICLLTMCRALLIQNEKADIIHRIPLT